MLPRNETMLPENSRRKSRDVRSGLRSMLMRASSRDVVQRGADPRGISLALPAGHQRHPGKV
jgi:hypothetical protein